MAKVTGGANRPAQLQQLPGEAPAKALGQTGKAQEVSGKKLDLETHQDGVQHQPPPAAVSYDPNAQRPAGKGMSQLGLLASQTGTPKAAPEPAVPGPSAKVLEAVGDRQQIDGAFARQLLADNPDFSKADLRYLLGWRADPNAVFGGESHDPARVRAFDSDAVEAVLQHFGNIDAEGKVSLWDARSTFEGDRRLDMGDVDFLLQSDGKLAGEIETRAKAAIDANDPFAALMKQMRSGD